MAIATKQVQGRRTLHFQSLDEMVADARRLVTSPATKMLGNWPLERLLTHLATAVNGSIDGFPSQAPWYIRLVGPLLKRRFLTRTMPAGFKLPKQAEAGFFPSAVSTEEAFEMLSAAVGRLRNERMTARHPVLGSLTHDEWAQLHMRHAELHLGFAIPDPATSH